MTPKFDTLFETLVETGEHDITPSKNPSYKKGMMVGGETYDMEARQAFVDAWENSSLAQRMDAIFSGRIDVVDTLNNHDMVNSFKNARKTAEPRHVMLADKLEKETLNPKELDEWLGLTMDQRLAADDLLRLAKSDADRLASYGLIVKESFTLMRF